MFMLDSFKKRLRLAIGIQKIDHLSSQISEMTELINFLKRQSSELFALLYDAKTQMDELTSKQDKLLGREIETIKKLLFDLAEKERPVKPHFEIVSDFKVAFDSPDHLVPWGTRNDSSVYHTFNEKLYAFLKGKSPLKFLDLGCAGAGFVQSLLEDGHEAIGIEGSDYSLFRKRASWRIIPARLFTCDVSRPFTIVEKNRNEIAKFDVITAWELMEHIRTESLDCLFENVRKHLTRNGFFILSVTTIDDIDPVTKTNWHQTVKPREWWIEQFQNAGFISIEQDIIGKSDWLRGSGHQKLDWNVNMEDGNKVGFHIVLQKVERVPK